MESRLEPDLITSYADTQNYNMVQDDHMASLAEVSIKRITIKGGIKGGAYECQKCPKGTISAGIPF